MRMGGGGEGVKEEKRCPRLLYRNSRCIIISGIFERRSSKPRLIFASYKRHVPPICRAEVGSKIKVCRPLYPARNRARPVAQRWKSTVFVSAYSLYFLFQFNSPTFHRSHESVSNSCRKKIYFTIEYRVSFPEKKKKKKSFRSFSTQTGIPSRFPISESKFTSVGLIDRFGSPYQLRARYREVFSRYATVAANFRESKRRLRTVLLSFYRWPLANGTAVRHAFVHKECAYHTSIYIYLLTPLPAPSCASSRDRK